MGSSTGLFKYIYIMEKWEAPMSGTLRISNPRTLQRWIDNGEYKKLIDEGYIFNPYCGRFNTEVCICTKCRNHRPNRDDLILILNAL
jgi:hypothetical protein